MVSQDLAIQVECLVKVYGGARPVRAVDGIDLEIRSAELFGLLGPNGAGKTTTLGVCTTRVKPTAGRALVSGVDVERHPSQVKHEIGVLSQFNTLDRSCTVQENLYFHCRFFGMSRGESRRRTDQLLEQFRLSDRAHALPPALSGGIARRLQVARAIAHRPRLLFLDEPTAGLDPQSRMALWDTVTELRRSGITVLLTTHYIEEADRLCDRVAIIDHGKVLICDTPAALKRKVGAETVIELSLAAPAAPLAERLRALEGVASVEEVPPSTIRLMAASSVGMLPKLVEATQGYGLRDISVTEPTLETVFISLTGRHLRD